MLIAYWVWTKQHKFPIATHLWRSFCDCCSGILVHKGWSSWCRNETKTGKRILIHYYCYY